MFNLIFFALALILVITLAMYAHKQAKKMAQRTQEELQTKGYVTDEAQNKSVGTLRRVWGLLTQPTPLYFQVSNLDVVQSIAGQAGIADVKIGDPEFDRDFVIRTSHPQVLSQILTPEIRNELRALREVRFRTGSIHSLLSADHLPNQKKDRDLRTFWMIEVRIRNGFDPPEQMLKTGKTLVKEIETLCLQEGLTGNLRTTFFEGR